ncbi:MAG: hypothetical protein EBE86_008700 [Hormoscilla sp. GUM202]|nr:hypothetical protein [Hormoscilla sp. GUM202]
MKKPGFVEKLGFWASIAGNSTFRSPQPRSKAGMDPQLASTVVKFLASNIQSVLDSEITAIVEANF